MKNTILIIAVVLITIAGLTSMTYTEAQEKSAGSGIPRIVFAVPVKPKSTIVTDGLHVKKYLNKGYQIQSAWYNHNTYENMYVVVKY